MSKMILKHAARKDIIRAGATYPSAVPSSYFQPSENCPPSGRLKKQLVLTSNRNARPRPAFGATRDEGAVGPIGALSPYADAVDYDLRLRKRTCLKSSGRGTAPKKPLETVAKGPTAERIISMTAAGMKPPVPGEEQIEKHKKSLSRISADMASAVSRHVNDKNQRFESISFENRNTGILSDKIPGYDQTWGVAFSREAFAPLVHPPGPSGANYPQNYPLGFL